MKNMCCPQCGYPDLVRARVRVQGGIEFKEGARCVTCGHRFGVEHAVFNTLRHATISEPYATAGDLHDYMCHFPMTRVQAIICAVAAALGLVVGVWLGIIWDQWLAGLVFFPIAYLGWWVGHWISPPKRIIPGHCPKCLYNLRGISGDRCPECGTTVDLREACDGDTKLKE